MGRRVNRARQWRTQQPKTPKSERPEWDLQAEAARENQLPTRRPKWLDELDDRLTWPSDQKPDLEVGDRLIVAWNRITIEDIVRHEPSVWIEITGYGQNKDFEHCYRYVIRGEQRGEFLAPTNQGDEHGITSSASKSIDPDAAVLPIDDNPDIARRDQTLREIKRLEQLRRHHLERLARTSSRAEMMRLTTSINDLDRKLGDLKGRDVLRTAA